MNIMQDLLGSRGHDTGRHACAFQWRDVDIVATGHTQRRIRELVGAAGYLWDWRECRRLEKKTAAETMREICRNTFFFYIYMCIKTPPSPMTTADVAHPGRSILQDVCFQLLHKHLVVEDNDGVVVAFSDQHVLEGLQHSKCFVTVLHETRLHQQNFSRLGEFLWKL